jgi:hypothetical protein
MPEKADNILTFCRERYYLNFRTELLTVPEA